MRVKAELQLAHATKGGLVTYYLLFVMEFATRRVCLAGCSPSPGDVWMMQVAQNLTDAEDGFLVGKRYLLMEQDDHAGFNQGTELGDDVSRGATGPLQSIDIAVNRSWFWGRRKALRPLRINDLHVSASLVSRRKS